MERKDLIVAENAIPQPVFNHAGDVETREACGLENNSDVPEMMSDLEMEIATSDMFYSKAVELICNTLTKREIAFMIASLIRSNAAIDSIMVVHLPAPIGMS